jgi:arsenical pump membrane protein
VPRPLAETVALLLLGATLAFAVIRPRGLPEVVAAVPAALLAVTLGILPARAALDELASLGPTIGFLAAVLLLGELCEREGLFAMAGQRMASASKGRPVALLGLVFGVGAAVTAVLSLDATVVLLTPVVFATAVGLRLRPKPHIYACTHLANSASLLLPVSNLTNLLAFRTSGLPFARFATMMTLPWLAAIGVEWLVLRRFFASDLVGRGEVVAEPKIGGAPRYAIVVLALTLVGFGVASLVHVDPVVVAALGAVALAVPALHSWRARPADLGRALALPFLAFVAALGVVVRAVSDAGLGPLVGRLVPAGTSLGSLLAVAVVAAVLANLVNNLPGHPAAAPGRGDRRANDGPGRPGRRERRAEPHLRRLAGHAAVAPGAVRAPRRAGGRGVPAAGRAHRPGRAAGRRRGAVGHAARTTMTAMATNTLRVLVWLVEGTWQGCVDAARPLLPAEAEVTLLHVTPTEVAGAMGGALAGLLGRGRPGPGRHPAERIAALADQAAAKLLAAAAARLGRPARRQATSGRVERVVVQADLLVTARDGDRSRLGPASLGPATRFVVDHAPCPVLLVWPDQAPGVESIPPPPPHPHPSPPGPPPPPPRH